MHSTKLTSPCKYHQKTPASWTCKGCGTAFCDACIPYAHSEHWGRSGPRCTQCNRELHYHNPDRRVTSFWNVLPHFFAYPFKKGCRGVIATVALIATVLPSLGFLAIIIVLIVIAICVKYSFLIIERRAENNAEPPEFFELFARDEHYLSFKLIVLIVMLYGGAYYFANENPLLYTILNGVVTFILPALTIILAIQKSLITALHPVVIGSIMLRIGGAYILIFFCYQIVSSCPTWIINSIGDALPQYASTALAAAIGSYFLFAANCMLGYNVYQYSDELGIADVLTKKNNIHVDRDTFDKKRALAEAYMLVVENDPKKARKLLRPLLDRFKRDAELHSFYHKLLCVLLDKEALRNHTDYFIELLIQQKRQPEAAQIYLATLERLPNYQSHDIECAYQIALYLDRQGRRLEIPKLLNNIHKLNLRHENLAPAYLLLAKVYSEHFNKDAQALKIIDFVLDIPGNGSARHDLIRFKKNLEEMA